MALEDIERCPFAGRPFVVLRGAPTHVLASSGIQHDKCLVLGSILDPFPMDGLNGSATNRRWSIWRKEFGCGNEEGGATGGVSSAIAGRISIKQLLEVDLAGRAALHWDQSLRYCRTSARSSE